MESSPPPPSPPACAPPPHHTRPLTSPLPYSLSPSLSQEYPPWHFFLGREEDGRGYRHDPTLSFSVPFSPCLSSLLAKSYLFLSIYLSIHLFRYLSLFLSLSFSPSLSLSLPLDLFLPLFSGFLRVSLRGACGKGARVAKGVRPALTRDQPSSGRKTYDDGHVTCHVTLAPTANSDG